MTANQVDGALAATPDQTGPLLLKLREDQWFDRKSAQIKPRDLAVVLTAFANAEGGVVVIGLYADKVQGLNSVIGKVNEFRQVPLDFTVPPVQARCEEVKCVNEQGKPDLLLVIRVDPGDRVHELSNGDCHLRVGDESRKLNFVQRRELDFDKGQSQYDGMPAPGVDMRQLDTKLIENYKSKLGAATDANKVLHARSLLTIKNEVTNAGYLLFGKHPQQLFPEAYIRILRFLSNERGTGARLGLEEGADFRIEGPIPRAIQEATARIEKTVPRRRSLTSSGRFEGVPIVPRDAWLEGLVNAVIHRSYSLAGDHIRVEIYPNRIEIESPGRFPGLANPDKPLEVNRFARNPRIARVCADLRIGQELGEGIKRIFEEMRSVGLSDPVYHQTAGSVKLVLAAIPRLDRRLAAKLPSGSQRVLDAMRAAGTPLGTGQLSELVGMSRPTLATRLKALEAERLVRWRGKSPKDPRAVWLLVED